MGMGPKLKAANLQGTYVFYGIAYRCHRVKMANLKNQKFSEEPKN